MTRALLAFVILAAPAFADPRLDQHGDPLPDGAIARFGTVRYRVGAHGSVWAWDLAPDGKTLAAADRNGITLWDVETGRPRKLLKHQPRDDESAGFGLCYSPDGKSLARVMGKSVIVLDANSYKQLFEQELSEEGFNILYLPDGEKLVIMTRKSGVFFLDSRSGKRQKQLDVDAPVESLSQSGKYFLGHEKTVPYLVDSTSGKLVRRFDEAEADTTPSWQLSPDEKRLFVAQRNGRFQTFDVQTGKKLQDIASEPDHGYGTDLTLSPDGNTAYLPVHGERIQRRDLKGDRWLDPLPRSVAGPILTLPGAKRVMQIGNDGVLRFFDLGTLKALPTTEGFEGNVFAYPSPDGRRLLTSSDDHSGERFDLFEADGKRLWSLRNSAYFYPVWRPDCSEIAFLGGTKIEFRDSTTSNAKRTIRASKKKDDFMYGSYTETGGKLIAVLNYGETIATYDTTSGKRISLAHAEPHSTVSLSPEGRTAVINASRKGIALFDLKEKRYSSTWIVPDTISADSWLPAPIFSADGSYLLTWDLQTDENTMVQSVVAILRDPVTLGRRSSFRLEHKEPFHYALSPDSLWLAISAIDGNLLLWDVALGKKLGEWKGHRDNINKIGFMGQGRVLTSSYDLTALLWDLRPKEKPTKLLWDALSGDDALEAYRAVWAVADDPKGPALLRSKITTAKPAVAEQVKQWLADLGADKYATRETATKELQTLGRLVEPELRAARAKATSEEVRTRLDALIAKVPRERSGGEIVHARAVAAMELSGSEAARKLLAEWAAGAPGARLTIDAKAALARIRP
jgi:WD40 repeat protein